MIVEKPLLHKCNVPVVFQEIINNYKRRHEILDKGFLMTQDDWREMKNLRQDLRVNLIPSAEKCLKHNVDKGSQ